MRRGIACRPDDKKNTRLIVAQAIVEELKRLNPSFPKVDAEQRKKLKKIARTLEE